MAEPAIVEAAAKLAQLSVGDLRASQANPRRLFDAEPLAALRESIRTHGVLVPLTVFRLRGQDKYGIIDGERRYRCCQELAEEDVNIVIPANIVSPPDEMARLIYMFNIHQFREQWELMPTALALQSVIEHLGTDDTDTLSEVTGLSVLQAERCRLILSYPEKYRALSIDGKKSERIPSNFWVELHPVLELFQRLLPDLARELGQDGLIDRMVEKYRAKRIRSVIHFRRILEANEVQGEGDGRDLFIDKLRNYVLEPELETRAAFDDFIVETRRISRVVDASAAFIRAIDAAKLSYASEGREELIENLRKVIDYVQDLLNKLEGDDPPDDG
ncbi:MAG: ParB/RepB/Spo0J family partition protein [Rhodospirillales bacterium]|nr:ParB/RepB/Spo0J family partition protein [Rhodospirillales bacterium]